MTRRHRGLAALLVLATACQPALPAVDQAAEEAAVLQWAHEFAVTEASNDDDAVMQLWWDDGVMQPPGGPTVVGAEAIRALYGTVVFESLEVGELSVKVSGDLAAFWGSMTFAIAVEGVEGLISDQAKFVMVLERRDGVWKAIENTWNSSLPPMAPTPAEE